MKIFLATWIYEDNQQVALNKQGADFRLMSYYHLSDKKNKKTLSGYVELDKTDLDYPENIKK